MGNVLRLTVRLIACFMLAISAIALWGNRQFADAHSPLVEIGDAPEVLGMRPGIMSYDAALQLLNDQHWTHLALATHTDEMFGQGSARVLMSEGRDHQVARIVLVASQSMGWGTFGQIVALLGPPQSLVVQQKFTESFWQSGQVEFIHEHRLTGFIGADDPLESMAVSAEPADIPGEAVLWKGFGSVEAYLGTALQ